MTRYHETIIFKNTVPINKYPSWEEKRMEKLFRKWTKYLMQNATPVDGYNNQAGQKSLWKIDDIDIVFYSFLEDRDKSIGFYDKFPKRISEMQLHILSDKTNIESVVRDLNDVQFSTQVTQKNKYDMS